MTAEKKSLLVGLIERLTNKVCCESGSDSCVDEPPLDETLMKLVEQIDDADPKNTAPLQCIYQLTKEENSMNRVPMICSSKFNLMSRMTKCLYCEEGNTRHLACLTLANLSIPYENKAVMALGPDSQEMFSALYSIIHKKVPEAYLCCICLVNLSFLDDAIDPIFLFTPKSSKSKDPLEVPQSAIRIIESLIQTIMYPPIVATVQSEAVRWCLVLLKNVSTKEHICDVIAKTKIPVVTLRYLKYTQQPLSRWEDSSVEDSSLRILTNLSKFKESRDFLKSLGTSRVIGFIIGQGGIHDYRASLLRYCLDATT